MARSLMARASLASVAAMALLAATATAQSDDGSRRPLPSPGCGVADASDAAASESIGEDDRRLEVHVPSAHDGETPLPLVIWLHGQGMSAAVLADVTGLPAFGEASGIVVAAPQGHPPDSGWMWEPGEAEVAPGLENRDVALVDALIDRLGDELCLDLARVYATGYSIGSHGATSLACRLADRIAAIVVTAGFTDLGEGCRASRPVPMIALAGTADDYILFEGGLGDFLDDSLPWGTTKGEEPFFRRPDWSLAPFDRAEAIAVRYGCAPGPTGESLAPGLDRFVWSCPAGADVELLVEADGGHAWEIEVAGVDANELYWSFLQRFALPE